MALELGVVRLISGDLQIVDESDDDAPLLTLSFVNEFARILDDSAKEEVFTATLESLADALRNVGQDKHCKPNRQAAVKHTKSKHTK